MSDTGGSVNLTAWCQENRHDRCGGRSAAGSCECACHLAAAIGGVAEFFMLRCRVCNPEMDADSYLPFGSAAERGKWAAAHRDALGHDLWHVIDLPRSGRHAMRGTVVYEPTGERHLCGPGWAKMKEPIGSSEYYWQEPRDVKVGTVVECDCGQTWVCVRDPGDVGRRFVVMPHNVWRQETRRQRKRRERHAQSGRPNG